MYVVAQVLGSIVAMLSPNMAVLCVKLLAAYTRTFGERPDLFAKGTCTSSF